MDQCLTRNIMMAIKIKKDEMGGACSMHWEMRNLYSLVGKTEGTRPLERPVRR